MGQTTITLRVAPRLAKETGYMTKEVFSKSSKGLKLCAHMNKFLVDALTHICLVVKYSQLRILISFIYPLNSWDDVVDVKHGTIVTQTRFQRLATSSIMSACFY